MYDKFRLVQKIEHCDELQLLQVLACTRHSKFSITIRPVIYLKSDGDKIQIENFMFTRSIYE